MRFNDLIVPWKSLNSDAKLSLIRHIRYRRHIEKPKKVAREKKEAKPKMKKAQMALDLLTPEQIEMLRRTYVDNE